MNKLLFALAIWLACTLLSVLGTQALGNWLADMGYGKAGNNSVFLILGLGVTLLTVDHFRFKRRLRQIEKKINDFTLELLKTQASVFKDEEIPDLMNVNAALDKIIESGGEDFKAMETILKYCSRIKPLLEWSDLKRRNRPNDKNIRGLTWEFGEVEIKDQRKISERVNGFEKTRIGQYKIWRSLCMVFFQHFWEADLDTVTNPLDAYAAHVILFDPTTFVPAGFGKTTCIMPKPVGPLGARHTILGVKVLTGELKNSVLPIGIISLG